MFKLYCYILESDEQKKRKSGYLKRPGEIEINARMKISVLGRTLAVLAAMSEASNNTSLHK